MLALVRNALQFLKAYMSWLLYWCHLENYESSQLLEAVKNYDKPVVDSVVACIIYHGAATSPEK